MKVGRETRFFEASVSKSLDAVNPERDKEVPDATPILGVIRVGEVASTIPPLPVGVFVVVIEKVPEEVIGPPERERMGGRVKLTEVTVP